MVMEATQLLTSPLLEDERVPESKGPTRTLASSSPRAATSLRKDGRHWEENIPSDILPVSFQGMLKTTTETGDIGMFSIKSSRMLPSTTTSTPRKIYSGLRDHANKARRPYPLPGTLLVDDRRRLPSYARDASSEVTLVYKNDSPESSSRHFEEREYRSCSMTQASLSSAYALSNHRSYTSLRSQPGGNSTGLLQRPRSPFAYPTRLKRPGFRPSSPALIDGGLIDYSRRAGFERVPQNCQKETPHSTSSPSSLYAQKRKPPLLLRSGANKSNPSLLSQTSPLRRLSSPNLRQTIETQSMDWSRRYNGTSVNTSPARSTLSFASIGNNCLTSFPVSTYTTLAKVAPPSPAYYDYTEDFEIDNCNQQEPVTLISAPQFRLENATPEDEYMSTDKHYLPSPDTDSHDPGPRSSVVDIPPEISNLPKSFDVFQDSSVIIGDTISSLLTSTAHHTNATPTSIHSKHKSINLGRETKVVRLSTEFSPPPELFQSCSIQTVSIGSQIVTRNMKLDAGRSTSSDSALSSPISQKSEAEYRTVSSLPMKRTDSSLGRQLNRPNEVDSLDTSFDGLTELFKGTDDNSKLQSSSLLVDEGIAQRKTPTISSKVPSDKELQTLVLDIKVAPCLYPINQQGTELCSLRNKSNRGSESQRHDEVKSQDAATSTILKMDVLNIMDQLSKRMTARSDSPLLAPKPISPARQLKLKNSVPQLMKALPALPRESTPIHPKLPINEQMASDRGTTFLVPSLSAGNESYAMITSPEIRKADPFHGLGEELLLQTPGKGQYQATCITQAATGEDNQNNVAVAQPISGSTFKTKCSREPSNTVFLPRNVDDVSHISSQAPGLSLPSLLRDDRSKGSKLPKFKLRVSRASIPAQGTVRINRDYADSRPLANVQFQHARDLFSPSPGFDKIFRQVSRHLPSRRDSYNSVDQSGGSNSMPLSIPISYQLSENESSATSSNSQKSFQIWPSQLSTAQIEKPVTDGNLRAQTNYRLRKRLSILRTRIAAPFEHSAGSRSHDHITLSNIARLETPESSEPSASKPVLGLLSNEIFTDGSRKSVVKLRRNGLRIRLRVWLKEAGSAITTRIKTRRTGVHGDDERAQLTAK